MGMLPRPSAEVRYRNSIPTLHGGSQYLSWNRIADLSRNRPPVSQRSPQQRGRNATTFNYRATHAHTELRIHSPGEVQLAIESVSPKRPLGIGTHSTMPHVPINPAS